MKDIPNFPSLLSHADDTCALNLQEAFYHPQTNYATVRKRKKSFI